MLHGEPYKVELAGLWGNQTTALMCREQTVSLMAFLLQSYLSSFVTPKLLLQKGSNTLEHAVVRQYSRQSGQR